jgi:hypothetical protein
MNCAFAAIRKRLTVSATANTQTTPKMRAWCRSNIARPPFAARRGTAKFRFVAVLIFREKNMPQTRDPKTGRFTLNAGSFIDSQGYPCFTAGPLRGIRIHRVIAAAKVGRPLTKDEDVHHADGDRLNPAPNNIVILSHKEHGCVSAKQHHYLSQRDIHLKNEWDQWFEEERGGGGRCCLPMRVYE